MNEDSMQHGIDYDGQDVSGWIATEKYNGCRAFWDGEKLWSRGGLDISLPDTWKAVLPVGLSLDGEIYDGPYGVYRCGSAIRYGRFTESMVFMVFDYPSCSGDYLSRLEHARTHESGPLKVVQAWTVSGISNAKTILEQILSRDGEGIVIRDPHTEYRPGRSSKILKLKDINTDWNCGQTEKSRA